jgi:hypothetical protein
MRKSAPIACTAAIALAATLGTAHAAIVAYPAADVLYSHTANGSDVNITSSPVAFDLADQFQDGLSGSPVASKTRYYGGFYTHTPNSSSTQWGGGFSLRFNFAGGGTLVFGKPAGKNELHINAPTSAGNSNTIGSYTGTETNLPFILKFEDDVWNLATVKVFVGPDALTPLEGTPTHVFNSLVSEVIVASISTQFEFSSWANGSSTGQLAGFYASNTWATPIIPEPAALALIPAALLPLARRRRA